MINTNADVLVAFVCYAIVMLINMIQFRVSPIHRELYIDIEEIDLFSGWSALYYDGK